MRLRKVVCHLAFVTLLTISLGSKADASFIVNIAQDGSDVVATGSGTINTAGLTYAATNNVTSVVVYAFLGGFTLGGVPADEDSYAGASGFSAFGSGGAVSPSSSEGDFVGIVGFLGAIAVPSGYTSGTALLDSDTWSSTTIADLGLTPGSYVSTWGSGETADSFTVNIESPTPEPGSVFLLGFGGIGLALHRLRRRIVCT